MNELIWKKYPVLNDGFICLVDVMGNDSAIVQAARVSYGKDERLGMPQFGEELDREIENRKKDRQLIRYLLNHSHTTPFEMVEFKFLVRVPMDCWRQWIRHRTASVNEYSTRYTEAIDSQQTTPPGEWRLQATDNKQGSSGHLEEWPEGWTYFEGDGKASIRTPKGHYPCPVGTTPGSFLTDDEATIQAYIKECYQQRLDLGIAKEQARKDLPLSTYTEAYWKCDLHNIFNFLRLRMDSHAQLEIRSYANAMAEIVKQVVPVAWEAFEDYVLHSKKFSRMEMKMLIANFNLSDADWNKPDNITDREWKDFLFKLS